MHKIAKFNELRSHVFTFKMKLKCGSKKCHRNLATASLQLMGEYTGGADTNPESYMRVDYVGDTFGWLHVNAGERVPMEKLKDPGNPFEQHYKYRIKCSAQPLVYSFKDGEQIVTRGRDRKAMARMGCGADHIIKRETLEREFLERLGLEPDAEIGLLTLGDCWEIENRLKATRGMEPFLLP